MLPMRLRKPLIALMSLAAALCGASTSTPAGGSVALSDVLVITKGVPDLEHSVRKAADDADAEIDGIACQATRLGNHYALLGGERTGPYNCPIGDKVLEVESVVEFLDQAGKVIDKSDDDSSRAASVREKDFKWTLRNR
jgi:hypothetical protein